MVTAVPAWDPAGLVSGVEARRLSLGAGIISDDCTSPPWTGGSGLAAGTGATRGVAILVLAGRVLRRFVVLCCGDENSFSNQFFAAKESVGGRRNDPKMAMAKTSRRKYNLPIAFNDFVHNGLH